MIETYIADLLTELKNSENKLYAANAKRYLRNQFDFFGLNAPLWRGIVKKFIKSHEKPETQQVELLVRNLWMQPQRECQYCALELLNKWFNDFDKDAIHLIEYLIQTKSWWDSIDSIAPSIFGVLYLNKFPSERDAINQKWIVSDNFWFRRSALLFQLKYKQKTDTDLLFDNIERCLGSKEFFINKAIGWMLREYSKTNPDLIVNYIEKTDLHPLSKREGLKYLIKKGIVIE